MIFLFHIKYYSLLRNLNQKLLWMYPKKKKKSIENPIKFRKMLYVYI